MSSSASTPGRAPGWRPALLTGAIEVAEHAATQGPRFARCASPPWSTAPPASSPAARGQRVAVVGITVINERIAEIDLILDPDKIASVHD